MLLEDLVLLVVLLVSASLSMTIESLLPERLADFASETLDDGDSALTVAPVKARDAEAVKRVFLTAEGGVVPRVFSLLLSKMLLSPPGDTFALIGDKSPKSAGSRGMLRTDSSGEKCT